MQTHLVTRIGLVQLAMLYIIHGFKAVVYIWDYQRLNHVPRLIDWGFALKDYMAISHFFGIPETTAFVLFGDQKEERTIVLSDTEKVFFPVAKTRFQVAKNIRDYVANYLDKDLEYNSNDVL